MIAISITPKDVPRIRGNTFYKILKYKGLATEFDKERYNNIRIDEVFMNLDLNCPVEYSRNINVLSMYDIIHHKEKTLMLLGQITKRPITEKIIKNDEFAI